MRELVFILGMNLGQKRDEHAPTTPEEQITKNQPSVFIDAGNLTDDHTFKQ